METKDMAESDEKMYPSADPSVVTDEDQVGIPPAEVNGGYSPSKGGADGRERMYSRMDPSVHEGYERAGSEGHDESKLAKVACA